MNHMTAQVEEAIHAEGEEPLDVERIRSAFPCLHQRVNGKPLVYLDNAATTQKPRSVLDAITHYYERDNANIHRGVHQLSIRATQAHELARLRVQKLLGAESYEQIIFVRGATEGINLVAQTFGRSNVREDDEILITQMEHHSNIVPWQMLCQQTGARLRVAPINDRGELIVEELEKLMRPRTRLIALAHVSNALGTVNPVREIAELARERGIRVLVDGAQAAPHQPIDVKKLGCDFYVLSGHKIYGPTGIGVLWATTEVLADLPPYQGGGEMIKSVTFEKTTYNDLPFRYEAGTPNIAGAIGLGAAIEYVHSIGLDRIAEHEARLLDYATQRLSAMPKVRIIGTAAKKAAVLSFVVEGIHPHDVGTVLDEEGVAVRTGHHCAQPVMERFGVPATARASFACHNTMQDVDALADAVKKAIEVFA